MNVDVTVVVPIRTPFLSGKSSASLDAVIAELIEASGLIPVRDHWGASASLSAIEIHSLDGIPQLTGAWRGSPFYSYRFLRFNGRIEINRSEVIEHLTSNNPGRMDCSPDQLDFLIAQMSAESFQHSVMHLLLAAIIAHPGAFAVDDLLTVNDQGYLAREGPFSLGFDGAQDRASEIGWPPLSGVSVPDAARWLMAIPGLLELEPRGPAGRAVSALSNLIARAAPGRDDAVGLMWCMVGLEALYGEGTANLRLQLVQKSRLLLGEPAEFKKAVGELYDFRSRFIHGDVDFPLGYNRDTDESGFSETVASATQLALALLVSTLQELVRRDRQQLKFEYRFVAE